MARLFVDKYIRHFQFAEERGRERSTWRTHGKLLRANWGNGEVGIFSVGCYVLQLQIGGRGTTKGNGRCFSPTWTSIATLWFPPNRGGYKRQPMQKLKLFVVSLHLEAMAANKLPKMTWLWKSWKKLVDTMQGGVASPVSYCLGTLKNICLLVPLFLCWTLWCVRWPGQGTLL